MAIETQPRLATGEFRSDSPLAEHRQLARLSSLCGAATVKVGDTTYSGSAEFLLPASGQAIVAFYTHEHLNTQDFGIDLVIEGSTESLPFRIVCPTCYVRNQIGGAGPGGWRLISPVNSPALLEYGSQRSIAAAAVLLNNFDYRCGDNVTNDRGFTRIGTPFDADLGRRRVTFRHRSNHADVQPLAKAGILYTASLTEFTFDVTPEDADTDLMAFADDVAALCTMAAGSGVSVATLTLRDRDGVPVRRVVPQPIESRYRRNDIIADFHLSTFFRTTFDEYLKMKQAHPAWRKLASYCGSLEDAPYLEEKFASLVMALEFFMRNCLIEHGRPEKEVSRMDLTKLLSAARKHLGWAIPKHYTARDTIRLWRNEVMHGGEWPGGDSAAFRGLFDKWRLFLFRRVFVRLGYQGKVLSPHKGWRSSSDVDDFTEERNAFEPVDP